MCPSVPPPPVGRKKEPRPGVCVPCPPYALRVRVRDMWCVLLSKVQRVPVLQVVRVSVFLCTSVGVSVQVLRVCVMVCVQMVQAVQVMPEQGGHVCGVFLCLCGVFVWVLVFSVSVFEVEEYQKRIDFLITKTATNRRNPPLYNNNLTILSLLW